MRAARRRWRCGRWNGCARPARTAPRGRGARSTDSPMAIPRAACRVAFISSLAAPALPRLPAAKSISARTTRSSTLMPCRGGPLDRCAVPQSRLAGRASVRGGHPELRLTEALPSVARLSCLTAPTAPLRPPLRERRFWRLVSHVSLGHLSIVGGPEGAAALREVLRLYICATPRKPAPRSRA